MKAGNKPAYYVIKCALIGGMVAGFLATAFV
jgi:hypothetical protein